MVRSLLAQDLPAASSLVGGKRTNRFSSFLRLPTRVTHLFNSSAQLHTLLPGDPSTVWADLNQSQSG